MTDIPTLTPTSTNTPTITIAPTPTIGSTAVSLVVSLNSSDEFKEQSFLLNFIFSHGKNDTDYYFKCYGGVGSDNYSVEVQNDSNWLNGYNGSWQNMPKFSTDSSGNISQNITIRVKFSSANGSCKITCKIIESAKYTSSGNAILSNSVYLNISNPPPSPTPTNTPTNTPQPTNVPSPTFTPTKTPTPTLSPISPSPTPTSPEATSSSDLITPTSEYVLGETVVSEISPTPVNIIKNQNEKKSNYLPMIFIISGGILLLIPLFLKKSDT